MTDPVSPDALRDLLRERGLTMDAAAVLAGMETSTISRWVNGQVKARPQNIVMLARALRVSAKRVEGMAAAAWDAAHPGERVSA